MERKNVRIGTLTFHMAHNYGAMLQAYALPIAINKLGFDCEVIDYRFPYIDRWSRVERINDAIANHGVIGGVLRYGKRLLTGKYRKDRRRIRFDSFEREIIPCSKKVYRRKSELDNMSYDVILFGSDQIWNSVLTGGIADEYVGGFECLPNTRKVAYAASCGTIDFQEESKEIYDECLKGFYAISVREEELKKSLVSRGFLAECVLDPTLLLTAKDWSELIPTKFHYAEHKYLLIYAFDEDERLYQLARDYAKTNDLEIVVITYEKKDSMKGMKVLTECGPLEFLSLFYNAEHVITTSFHGTVFSIIFHKTFQCIPHPKYRERTDSLLNMLRLNDHNMNELERIVDVKTDWDKVDVILKEKREESNSFLRRAILDNRC